MVNCWKFITITATRLSASLSPIVLHNTIILLLAGYLHCMFALHKAECISTEASNNAWHGIYYWLSVHMLSYTSYPLSLVSVYCNCLWYFMQKHTKINCIWMCCLKQQHFCFSISIVVFVYFSLWIFPHFMPYFSFSFSFYTNTCVCVCLSLCTLMSMAGCCSNSIDTHNI